MKVYVLEKDGVVSYLAYSTPYATEVYSTSKDVIDIISKIPTKKEKIRQIEEIENGMRYFYEEIEYVDEDKMLEVLKNHGYNLQLQAEQRVVFV